MKVRYYVYRHIDPRTYETMYVGKGCYGRAWDVTRNRSNNKEHTDWLKELCSLGYTPEQFVYIDTRGLTEAEAFEIEKNWLHSKGCPKFNRQSGEKNYQAKLTDEQAREIFQRANTEQHKELAKEFGVSRSAISMIASRKQWRAATACLITQN